MLSIQEGIVRDEMLDVDGRNQVLNESRQIIREMYSIAYDPIGNAQVDQILADSKYLLLKKRSAALSFVAAAESYSDSEYTAGDGEESATMLVSIALPEERQRITDLLSQFPEGVESKTNMLVQCIATDMAT